MLPMRRSLRSCACRVARPPPRLFVACLIVHAAADGSFGLAHALAPLTSPPHSLHDAIRAASRPLPEETIWRVLLQVTLALHHMHGR